MRRPQPPALSVALGGALIVAVAMTWPSVDFAPVFAGPLPVRVGAVPQQSLPWTVVPVPVSGSLFDISAVSPDDAWAVATGATGQPAEVLRYSGGAWEVVESYPDRNLLAVDMVSSEEGWVAGFDLAPIRSVLLPIRGGQLGAPVFPPCSALIDVEMIDSATGWAAGSRSSGTSSASCILRFSGGSWQRVNSPGSALIVALAMTSVEEGWAFGSEGALLRRANEVWTEVPSPWLTGGPLVTDGSLSEPGNGWAVGSGAQALRLTDETWTTTDIGHAVELLAVDIISREEGWAVGRTEFQWPALLRFDGTAWEPQDLPDLGGLRQLTAIDMLSTTDGWAVGGSTALRYHVDPRTPSPTAAATRTSTPTPTPGPPTGTPSNTPQGPDTSDSVFLPWAWRR